MSIIDNRKAFFDYFIEERYEAGLVLEGWEVKAIRAGEPPAVTGAEGVTSLAVAMRCLQGDVMPAQRKPRRVVG